MLSNSEVFLGNVLTKINRFFKNIWRLIDREAGFISAHFFSLIVSVALQRTHEPTKHVAYFDSHESGHSDYLTGYVGPRGVTQKNFAKGSLSPLGLFLVISD